eukprot:278053-Prymnesium_polylepis.2
MVMSCGGVKVTMKPKAAAPAAPQRLVVYDHSSPSTHKLPKESKGDCNTLSLVTMNDRVGGARVRDHLLPIRTDSTGKGLINAVLSHTGRAATSPAEDVAQYPDQAETDQFSPISHLCFCAQTSRTRPHFPETYGTM